MASCYWAQPGQLHPWYKLDSLKRKLPEMFPHSESPSPVDEYDSDPRAKRQRRTTLDQMRSMKRRLPSPPQSPVEEDSGPDDARLFKRQRCTTLEREIESLSLATIPPPPVAALASSTTTTLASNPQAQTAPEFNTSLLLPPLTVSSIPVHGYEHHIPLDYASSLASLQPPLPPSPFPTSTPITSMPFAPSDVDAITDVKMRSSSWYEPQKDRIIVTDLDASSDDEADVMDDAPKLPRSVLQALLRGPKSANAPFPELLLSPVLPQLASQSLDPPPSLDLHPGSLFEPGSDEAMDVE